MKRKLFLAFLAAPILYSCDKADGISPADTVEVTTVVENSLRKAVPDASNISYTEVSPTTVQADFTSKRTEMLAGITKKGDLQYLAAKLTDAQLPAIALDYLTATYSGYTLKRAGEKKDTNGVTTGFVANIEHADKKYHIHFDATGKFVSSEERTGKQLGKGEKLTQEQLPEAIKTYLTANYPNYTFYDAYVFKVNDIVKGYGVRITTAEKVETGLMFDGEAKFLRSREGNLGHGGGGKGKGPLKGKDGTSAVKIEKSALPAGIITYLDANYAGYTFEQAHSISKDGAITNYLLHITVSGKRKHVLFDAKGVFVQEGKKKG